MMSALTTHCQWEDETVRKKTGNLNSYAVAKKLCRWHIIYVATLD